MAEAYSKGPGGLGRVILASLIGTTIEWYDFFLYGSAAALVFNKLFFPKSDPLTGTLLAFATYAAGLRRAAARRHRLRPFRRPHRPQAAADAEPADDGRSRPSLIGLLPTYDEHRRLGARSGWSSLRLVQGFAVGGEWGGAVLMVAEHGDAERRGFWAGWPQAGVPAGNLLAAGVLALMADFQSEADFLAWGWRVPFLLSAVLVVVGWWVRIAWPRARSSRPSSRPPRRRRSCRSMDAVRERPGGSLLGAGLRVGENICFYVITTFALTYLVDVAAADAAARAERHADRRGGPVRRHPAPRQRSPTGSAAARSMRSARSASASGASPSSRC